MIPIAQFYLGATPNAPLNSAPFQRPQSMSQVSLQRSPTRGAASPPASGGGPGTRASMPPPRRSNAADNSASSFVNQSPPGSGNSRTNGIPPVSEADEDADLRGNVSKGSPQSKSGLSSPTSAEKEKDKQEAEDEYNVEERERLQDPVLGVEGFSVNCIIVSIVSRKWVAQTYIQGVQLAQLRRRRRNTPHPNLRNLTTRGRLRGPARVRRGVPSSPALSLWRWDSCPARDRIQATR